MRWFSFFCEPRKFVAEFPRRHFGQHTNRYPGTGHTNPATQKGVNVKDADVIAWYEQFAKPFLEKHAPERLASVEADYQRLKRLKAKPDEVTICCLGNSGVGKSTLLNGLAAG